MSDAWDVAKEVGGSVFGDGDDPGVLGLGQKDVKKYDIDPNAFVNPDSTANKQELANRLGGVDSRTAPTATAATQTGIREYGGATVAPTSTAARVQLSPAAQAGQTMINRAEDQQFRQGQMTLAQQLAEQAAGRGPSLAEGQLKLASDRNIKQQMAVAAAQGGNPAMAQRGAALGQAQAARQLGADTAQARIQEQIAARQQLAGVLGQGRDQDIGVANAQAGLLQQVNLANMGALNQFGLQQGSMDMSTNQFNATALNSREALQAQLAQQAGLASQGQYNTMLAQNTANQQATNLANMQSQLQTMGLNDAQIRYLLDAKMQQSEADRQAQISLQQMQTNNMLGVAATENAAYNQSAAARAAFVASLTEQDTIKPQDYGKG